MQTQMRVWALGLVAAGLASASALAWDNDVHLMIADIAWEYMTPAARSAMENLLKADKEDKTLADASTWADRVRNEKEYAWARPLHYALMPEGVDRFDMQRDGADGKCAVAGYQRYLRVLRDSRAGFEERREALKLVCHLLGDLHQPLHAGYTKDLGGTAIQVTFFDTRTNLHVVWDGELLKHTGKPWKEYAAELKKSITDEQRQQWAAVFDPAQWATESYKLAVSHAYKLPRENKLGDDYVKQNLPVVDERLKMAGVRLATVLNKALAPAGK